ncbi:hypothetical protein FB451DRAFT_1369912 [Mycena latifolia]|nr:hypothetical protein FB451DRAFT_1369912 [Mycena latifolia]
MCLGTRLRQSTIGGPHILILYTSISHPKADTHPHRGVAGGAIHEGQTPPSPARSPATRVHPSRSARLKPRTQTQRENLEAYRVRCGAPTGAYPRKKGAPKKAAGREAGSQPSLPAQSDWPPGHPTFAKNRITESTPNRKRNSGTQRVQFTVCLLPDEALRGVDVPFNRAYTGTQYSEGWDGDSESRCQIASSFLICAGEPTPAEVEARITLLVKIINRKNLSVVLAQ